MHFTKIGTTGEGAGSSLFCVLHHIRQKYEGVKECGECYNCENNRVDNFQGVGHVCLNLNFWQSFPYVYTRLKKTKTKNKNKKTKKKQKKIFFLNQKYLISYVKNHFNRKSVRV